MNPCASRAELQDLLAERLTEQQERSLLSHVETCQACQAILEELTAYSPNPKPAGEGASLPTEPSPEMDSFWHGLKGAVPQLPLTSAPGHIWLLAEGGEAGQAEALPGHLGRYEVLEEIGRGGMGAVLRGHDPDLGRDLAIKVLLPGHQHDPAVVRRFTEEAQIGGQLQHPGIVPVYEVGRAGEMQPYFAMKLIRGRTLAALLRERTDPRQDLPRFEQVFEQVCQTMAYAHSRGVIHRDLKPSNIMVGAFGEVQVMDWGLAKVLPRKEQGGRTKEETRTDFGAVRTVRSAGAGPASQPGHVLGTPAYMAPEQAWGEVDRLDERSDVFGLGAILCEILTGQPPYGEGEDHLLLRKAARADLGEALARLEVCRADAGLIRLARRGLAPDPANRPRDAGVLAAEMASYRESMEARLRQAEVQWAKARTRAEEERKRRRVVVGLAVALLVLVAGVASAGLWYQHDRARAADEQARRDREEALRRARLEGNASSAADKGEEQRRQAPGLTDKSAEWQAKLSAAQSAAQQAQALLGQVGEAASPALRRRVGKLVAALEADQRDRDLVAQVERIRLEQSAIDAVSHRTRRWRSFPELRVALERYGLRVGDTRGAVALIGRRPKPVREKLVAALDFCLANAEMGRQVQARAWLLAVLAGADGNTWRMRARRAYGPALARLVRMPEAARQPRAFLALLVGAAGAFEGQEKLKLALLRRAHQRSPGDFWVANDLAFELFKRFRRGTFRRPTAEELPRLEEVIGYYRAALALRPASARVYGNLGAVLQARWDLKGAIAAHQKAIALEPRNAYFRSNLGTALQDKKDLKGAIAAHQKAIELNPKIADFHNNLGTALYRRKDLPGAIASFREACLLDPRHVNAHNNLALALVDNKDLKEALAFFGKAIKRDPTFAPPYTGLGLALVAGGDVTGGITRFRQAIECDPRDDRAHYYLGIALMTRGDAAGAIAAYRKSIDIDPRSAPVHTNLGNALLRSGDVAGAIAACRKAIELDPKCVEAHGNLGAALHARGDVAGAIAAYRKAIASNPKYALSHGILGHLLLNHGRFVEARAATNRCLELLGPDNSLHKVVTQQLRLCERVLALDKKLIAILKGEAKPADTAERLALTGVCQARQLHAAAARFYAEAFADRPRLADDLPAGLRYKAACSAALAGCGRGKDTAGLSEKERARWRSQAQKWLRADLILYAKHLERGRPTDLAGVRQKMRNWLADADFAGVRGTEAYARLPAEWEGWAKLWVEVEVLRKKAHEKAR
jgi:serine/threonine protein kinase/Flp pilus assembly protein TadD